MFVLHPSPHLIFPLLRCWVTPDLLARTCTHDKVHSMLILTLHSNAFDPSPPNSPSPFDAFYAIPSLPPPLRWRLPDPSLLSSTIRSQSPGSVSDTSYPARGRSCIAVFRMSARFLNLSWTPPPLQLGSTVIVSPPPPTT